MNKYIKIGLIIFPIVTLITILLLSFRFCYYCGNVSSKENMTFQYTFIGCEDCFNQKASELTERRMRELLFAIMSYKIDNEDSIEPHPKNIDQWKKELLAVYNSHTYRHINQYHFSDAWGNPIQYRDDELGYLIISAGADGVFDTTDDIIGAWGTIYNAKQYKESRDYQLKQREEQRQRKSFRIEKQTDSG